MGDLNFSVQTEDIHFSYGHKKLIDGVSINILQGQSCYLIGKNGSGKSTLLNLISGQLKPDSGRVLIEGKPLKYGNSRENALQIAYLRQSHHGLFPFTVREVVLTGRYPHVRLSPGANDEVITQQAMEMAGIMHLENSHYTELSGGEQQLVMIARVLAQQSRVILMDEPFAHLDLKNLGRLAALLKKLSSQKISLITVVHDPAFALMQDAIVLGLLDGKLVTVNPDEKQETLQDILMALYETRLKVRKTADGLVILPIE